MSFFLYLCSRFKVYGARCVLICGAARRYKGKTKQNNYTIIHEYEKTFSYAFSDCIGSPDIM